MSATFVCPHCGASYPVKPVLVGRAVRCTTCKHPFKLRADGIADKVVDPPAAAPAPAPAPTPVVTAPALAVSRNLPPLPPAAPTPLVPSATSAPAQRPPTGSVARGSRTERLNRQQEDARKAMAATLSNAASAALSAETVKREAEAETKALRKKVAAKPGTAAGEGRVGDIGPVVLTGTGQREHRNRLVWLLGAIAAVGAVYGRVLLISLKSPQRRALMHYASLVEDDRTRHPARIPAIQERAWVVGVPALTDLGRLNLGQTRTIPFLPAREVIARLKGLTYQAANKLWVAPERLAEVDKWWNPRKDRAANLTLLAGRKVPVLDQRLVATDLEAAGWNADDVDLFLQLVQAHTDRSGANWIAKKLFAGELPEAIEVTSFAGAKASQLVDIGRAYKSLEVDYSGRLLRFVGDGWPGECKVLEITTASGN